MQDTVRTETSSGIFREYLTAKGIRIVDEFKGNKINLYDLSKHEINDQLNALREFHHRASGYVSYSRERIKTCTGKDVEKYKVELRKIKRDFRTMDEEYEEDSFEKFLLSSMDENIKRAEKCLKLIYDNGYISLITRSMKEKEICIGDSSFKNLRFTDMVEIISINDCSFNMVENDAVYLLRKIKRKGAKVDFNEAAEEFCRLEELDEKSSIYILALISYPYEFMKYYSRFKENKRGLSSFEWKHKLKKAMYMDGKSLI